MIFQTRSEAWPPVPDLRSWNGMSSVYTILNSTTLESNVSEASKYHDVYWFVRN
jgi:hypothetical protein